MMVWRRRKHVSFATLWIVFAMLCLRWASYGARSWCLLLFLPLNLTANYRLVCSIKRLRSGRRGDSTLGIVYISGARVDKTRGIWNHVKRRLSSGRINYIEFVSNERHEMKETLNFSSRVFTLNKWMWERRWRWKNSSTHAAPAHELRVLFWHFAPQIVVKYLHVCREQQLHVNSRDSIKVLPYGWLRIFTCGKARTIVGPKRKI